jgi:hypothetical protein
VLRERLGHILPEPKGLALPIKRSVSGLTGEIECVAVDGNNLTMFRAKPPHQSVPTISSVPGDVNAFACG